MVESQAQDENHELKNMKSRVFAVSSGKGGVGKSNFAINLGIQMKHLGKRVVIVDADFGLSNVEILLGSQPKYSVTDVVNGKVKLQDALTEGPLGCMYLSGGTGMSAITDLSEVQLTRLVKTFAELDDLTDCIIIDTRAGLSNVVLNFIKASTDAIIVTTPDPTAIADAYALLKSAKAVIPEIKELQLVVNCAINVTESKEVFEKLNAVSNKFLEINLINLGSIPYDINLIRAVRKQKPVSIVYPYADSSKSFAEIAAKLMDMDVKKTSSVSGFILKLIGKFSN